MPFYRTLAPLLLFCCIAADRWILTPPLTISTTPTDSHSDHLEFSGQLVSCTLTYSTDASLHPSLKRQIVWPTLRFKPNQTTDHLVRTFDDAALPTVLLDSKPLDLTTTKIEHSTGITTLSGTATHLTWSTSIFPSPTQPAILETHTLTNPTDHDVTLDIQPHDTTHTTNPDLGTLGPYAVRSTTLNAGPHTVAPHSSLTYTLIFSAQKAADPLLQLDPATERTARETRVKQILSTLILDTPDPLLNTAFNFAKLRTCESVYKTKVGLLHSPGGTSYHAAVWANDQAEYTNPLFAYLGDPDCATSALNSFKLFAKYLNPDYTPIPSSITGEGDTFWNGAGDRGDAAMLAYGASRFALARGDQRGARQLWPLIEWSLEYCRRHLTADGVVSSDCDELENRFPAGKANLATSCLYYDALLSASYLARDLHLPDHQISTYTTQAAQLRIAIDKHFSAKINGFDTYRYYAGNTTLRAWICLPLCVNIFDRAPGTTDALFSPKLWTPDGLATESGKPDFWDRSTLYALRGAFAANDADRALDHLTAYTRRRLLGDHVPYPVESSPEGDQRHLAAESALYCRIFTEGLLHLRPTGLRSFTLDPHLPKSWDHLHLNQLNAFGTRFSLHIDRTPAGSLELRLLRDNRPPFRQTLPASVTLD